MNIFTKTIIIATIFLLSNVNAKNYYVSTMGNDDTTGTIDTPFKTITKLLSVIQPGDIGIIRGGVYPLDYTTQRSGTEQNPIVITAYIGEHPVLKGNGRRRNGGRFRVRHNWYIIENLELKNGDAGFTFTHNASHNILRNCSAHYHYWDGVYIADGASYNQIINCDVYDMYDSGSNGGNADGFAVNGQSDPAGPGNKLINCHIFRMCLGCAF